VRRYLPAILELQETVAVLEPLIVLGLIEPHVKPEGGVSVRVIVPVNPFWAAVLIVEAVDWPAFVPAGLVAVSVKSGAGGPRLRNLSRQPHPGGLLAHCIAPYIPALGVSVQLPAGHQIQLILWGVLLS